VRKIKTPEDLSIDELRQLMVEKRRRTRMQHLERFRRTGRVVTLTSDDGGNSDGHLHSNTESEPNTNDHQVPLFDRIKNTLDHFLLGVEILAVIGLFFIIFSGIQILRNLNTQFSEALIPSTLTPTPLIVPVILPSGHTPPNSQNGAQPNEGEIPAHLLPLYQSMAQIPIPTPGPEQAIQIQIPMINVDAPVVQGDGWEQLKKGVAQHTGSANPGQSGNVVLSAHNDVFGELFRYLDQLQKGDEIIIYTANHAYTYIITDTKIVSPTEVEVMAPTTNPTATLISCYPYMIDNKRIVVQASIESGGN
jgi:sortase A